ncbi:hypothetical protein MHU86_19887 [Fragilaria crotonensis]|nr:hypothetical protein MHU86_19887 [Fragilaria crotonensis]
MYGGVDVPRLFMKTLFRYLTQVMKMIQSLVDPCLYYWKNTAGEVTLMAVVHVDDVLLAGKKETIEKFKSELKKRFNISDLGRLKKHLGVWYDWKTDDNGESYIVASMTKLEDEIVESFETSVGRSIKEAETRISKQIPKQEQGRTCEDDRVPFDCWQDYVSDDQAGT